MSSATVSSAAPKPRAPRPPRLTMTAPKEFDPLEKIHQEKLVALCDQHAQMLGGKWACLTRLYHVPNGDGKVSIEVGRARKRQGLRPGVPDLRLDVPSRGYGGLVIELKRFRAGSVTEPEADWLVWLASQGFRTVACFGWRAAWEELLWYLDLPLDGQPRLQTHITAIDPYFVRKQRI